MVSKLKSSLLKLFNNFKRDGKDHSEKDEPRSPTRPSRDKSKNSYNDKIGINILETYRANIGKHGTVLVTLQVDPKYYGRIIGKHGKVIKKIQGDFKVIIKIPKKMDDGLVNSNLITILGNPDNTAQAKEFIIKFVDEIITKK